MSQNTNAGRGRGGRTNRTGRGRGRSSGRGNSQSGNKKKLKIPDTALKELGDNIFVVNYPNQADKNLKTEEAILVHIQQNMKFGEDMRRALKQGNDYNFDPEEPQITGPIDTTTMEGFKFKIKMEAHNKRLEESRSNKPATRGLIYNQCEHALKIKLQERKDWKELEDDPFKLLKVIKEITHNYKDTKYYIASTATSIRSVFFTKQQEGEGLINYSKRFKTDVDVMELHVGKLSMEHLLSTDGEYVAATEAE